MEKAQPTWSIGRLKEWYNVLTFHEDAIGHDQLEDGGVEVGLVVTQDAAHQSDTLLHVLILVLMDSLKGAMQKV